ncbi:UNVERIFIED_CONTAM: hypothetical protein RMT77_011625 [Armadillidium vulgare]
MNIKSKSEIKIEELDSEYDSNQQDFQIFSDNESDFTLKAEDIKIEEIVEKVSIKSELTESEMESVLGEGQVNTGVIKSENVMMIEEKSCGQHSKERNCFGSIDVKSEIEVKEEPFDIEEEEAANDELERDCYGSMDVKSEIEVKEEHFDFEEEEAANDDELFDKIYELDQNQVRIKCF